MQSWTYPSLPEGYGGLRDVLEGCNVLHSAILSGVKTVVEAVWATLGPQEVHMAWIPNLSGHALLAL